MVQIIYTKASLGNGSDHILHKLRLKRNSITHKDGTDYLLQPVTRMHI